MIGIKLVNTALLAVFLISFGETHEDSNEKFEPEFGIEAHEEDQKFETKAHFHPGTFYYVLKDNNGKKSQAQTQSSSRPYFHQHFPMFKPRIQASSALLSTPTIPTLPPLTPKDIPEQLRLLGYTILGM